MTIDPRRDRFVWGDGDFDVLTEEEFLREKVESLDDIPVVDDGKAAETREVLRKRSE